MKRMWIGAVALLGLGLVGCGSKVEHIWDAPGQLSVLPGSTCVSGPWLNPSGGAVFWDISSLGDNMDVAVMPDGYGCNASSPYGYSAYTNSYWSGRVSPPAVAAPGGPYSLAITCYNVDYCSPYVYAFGYED